MFGANANASRGLIFTLVFRQSQDFEMTPSNSNFLRLVEAEIEKCYGAFLEAKDDEFDVNLT